MFPKLPTWGELRNAQALPDDILSYPGMPTDPTFLDKPIRGYMMRLLTVVPTVNVCNLFIDLLIGKFNIQDHATMWALSDSIVSGLFSMFGYHAMKGLIPEWIAIFTYYYLIKCLSSLGWAAMNVHEVIVIAQGRRLYEEVDVTVVLLVVMSFVNIVTNYLVVVKMVVPLRHYAIECRHVRRTGRKIVAVDIDVFQ
ncbi:UNVERIFIED_CONTAM: hypothetical protein HDU68_008272 [Siphonaria sp. JEL0065]|nr:hypothetical protein HDU68_008272 [Siphonaria sp. JEL0065]